MKREHRVWIALSLVTMCAASQAEGRGRLPTAVNVSCSTASTDKGRLVSMSFVDGDRMVYAMLIVYLDASHTPNGESNVYARRSTDGGGTWEEPVLLSRDAYGQPTGGRAILVQGTLFHATNQKASAFAPQSFDSGADRSVLVTWCSSYCPTFDGQLPNPEQSINTAMDPPRPYMCVWAATSVDAGATWQTEQLTDGRRDAMNDVVAGSQANDGFAIAWQEDPLGLQPGEAEGPGDGGSGAHTTPGTNIWYTWATSLRGTPPLFRGHIVSLTDNVAVPSGSGSHLSGPGASRPVLQMSGSTAAIVYEESKGGGGKAVHYHSFKFRAPDVDSPGTVVSDPARTARRARVVLQGKSSADGSPLRALILYRQGEATMPGAPADVFVQRGLEDPTDPASTGFRPQDIEPFTAARNISDPDGTSAIDNARAHRAVLRGWDVAVGYTHTPDMLAAEPDADVAPTQNYNFFVRVSRDAGATFAPASNLSEVGYASISVGEPRLVPTPRTIVNPLTGVPDPGYTQNVDVLHAAWGLYANDRTQADLVIKVKRSTDFGATFDPVMTYPERIGQSEAQLRSLPDGSQLDLLWMQEMDPDGARDVWLSTLLPTPAADAPAPAPAAASDGDSRCFIATAAYGSPLAEEVRHLRAFRDRCLMGSRTGRQLIAVYYRVSPPIAAALRESAVLRRVVRVLLTPVVTLCRALVADSPPPATTAAAAHRPCARAVSRTTAPCRRRRLRRRPCCRRRWPGSSPSSGRGPRAAARTG